VLGRVPVHFIPCIQGRVDTLTGPGANAAQAGFFGSILPAVWSFMLAARSHGLGTAWTTLHLVYEKQVAEILGIPFEQVTQAALVPVAYYTGTTFKPAMRKEMDGLVHWDQW
jgi:nitroreductase